MGYQPQSRKNSNLVIIIQQENLVAKLVQPHSINSNIVRISLLFNCIRTLLQESYFHRIVPWYPVFQSYLNHNLQVKTAKQYRVMIQQVMMTTSLSKTKKIWETTQLHKAKSKTFYLFLTVFSQFDKITCILLIILQNSITTRNFIHRGGLQPWLLFS